MSKAFTREDDSLPEPELKAARRPGPSHVTLHGRERLLARATTLGAVDPAEGRILVQRIEAAQVVMPRAAGDVGPIRFGDRVAVRIDGGPLRRLEIVSADEAELPPEVDAYEALSASSPLARALIGAEVGEVVTVELPSGDELEVGIMVVV